MSAPEIEPDCDNAPFPDEAFGFAPADLEEPHQEGPRDARDRNGVTPQITRPSSTQHGADEQTKTELQASSDALRKESTQKNASEDDDIQHGAAPNDPVQDRVPQDSAPQDQLQPQPQPQQAQQQAPQAVRAPTKCDMIILGRQDALILLHWSTYMDPATIYLTPPQIAANLWHQYYGNRWTDRTIGLLNPQHDHICGKQVRSLIACKPGSPFPRDEAMLVEFHRFSRMNPDRVHQELSEFWQIRKWRMPQVLVSCNECNRLNRSGELISPPAISNNPGIFIGGLTAGFTEADIRTLFGGFGQISLANTEQTEKGCIGGVEFKTRYEAEIAICNM